MAKCIIIGGGFAGLTSASYLSNAGIKVELFEASPKPGGRAYSFKDNSTGSVIDNGQHILMGCYHETLKFINLIGAENNLRYQDKLKVNFIKEGFKIFPLKAYPLPYPLNLLAGLLEYKALSLRDRIIFLKFFLKLPFCKSSSLKNLTVYDWLKKENQNENIIEAFWDILVVGALNTDIRKASALIFYNILKQIFLSGNKAATIILPRYGLSETYCENSRKFIEENGGIINLSEGVTELVHDDNSIIKVKTDKRIIDGFDFVISSVPLFAAGKIINFFSILKPCELNYSSILSIHIWLKENNLLDDFYGLIGSTIHWIFNHGDHITLVISDAGELINKSGNEITSIVFNELYKFANIKSDDIISYKIIKEKRATFIPSNEIINKRSGTKTKLKNFLIAGDWVDTGLPSTIESAVKSGRLAADMILNYLKPL